MIKDNVPIANCPHCSGNCYAPVLPVSCEKCGITYEIDLNSFPGFQRLSVTTKEKIQNAMKEMFSNRSKSVMRIDDNHDHLNEFKITYSGDALSLLKTIRKEYNLPNLLAVALMITSGFFFIMKEMRKLPGNKIYLVDSMGNKSGDIKKGFLSKASREFNKEMDKRIVNNYLDYLEGLIRKQEG